MKRLLLYASFLALTSCSSPHPPAPVSVLNSQPEVEEDPFQGETYTVQTGDTLFAIAWYSGNDYRDIAKWNNIPQPYTIYAGQKVKLRPQQTINTKVVSVTKPSGQTRKSTPKIPVDPTPKQAYGERKEIVKTIKPSVTKKPEKQQFPDKVTQWMWPTQGNIIATFSRSESGSKGLDIQAKKGDPIVAAASGKVVYSGSALRGYGNLIIIKHTDNFLSAYAHNDEILVKEREWVDIGQKIATMGDSGTNEVKLHFEIRYRGRSLDPKRYLPKK
jgi:lipoprotein NlpD